MLVDVRPTSRLRGAKATDVAATLAPIMAALRDTDSVDLSRLRVVCDWIQYKDNFREQIDVRTILSNGPAGGAPADGDLEIAVDLRRSAEGPLAETTRALLRGYADNGLRRCYLEPWVHTTESCVWDFNALYWRALDLWEKATGRLYEQALPGGESDARNTDAVRALLGQMFGVWDDLAARNSLPEELYVVELGVGNGGQAKVWLDEFRAMDRARGTAYYGRLNYLMCDYSPHVLEQARITVADHEARISALALDARSPTTALGFLRGKIFLVYVSNVYDNLPNEEVARIGGRNYRVESRAYVTADDATLIAEDLGCAVKTIRPTVGQLLRLGPALLAETRPDQFPSSEVAVTLWRELWAALRLEERYVPLPGLDMYRIAERVSGEILQPLLESDGDIRMHVNNGAVASFVDTLPLLHPFGRLLCHDLFVTDVQQFQNAFRGPGKYDGSVVNWCNGPLLRHIGGRAGFDVGFERFAHRTGTNIVTMTAQVRD